MFITNVASSDSILETFTSIGCITEANAVLKSVILSLATGFSGGHW